MPRGRVTFSPIGEGIDERHRRRRAQSPKNRASVRPRAAAKGEGRTPRRDRDCQELRDAEERVLAFLRVDEQEDALEQTEREEPGACDDRLPVAGPAREDGGQSHDDEEQERERREPEREAARRTATQARPSWSAFNAPSAAARPAAYG